MAHKLHRNRELIAELESMLESARLGDITDMFAVVRDCHGEYEHSFCADNLDDMLYEAATALMDAQIDRSSGFDTARKH